MIHVAVLQKEVLQYLDPKPDENFIDCTIGEGNHAVSILEKNGPRGKILGIEWDQKQIENCKLKIENYKNRVVLVCDSFTNLKEIVDRENFKTINGILFDLGMSSWHLEESKRGFSFLKDEPLDMRYCGKSKIKKITSRSAPCNCKAIKQKSKILTAEEIVNSWSEIEIEKILEEYGQERFAKKIAKKIVDERKISPIQTTFQLVEIIKRATPSWYHYRKIHFATKTFQALRIAVNDELNNLKKALPQALEVLSVEGRIVVISFHSLEDRIVKNFFKNLSPEKIKILTKKPIIPTQEEIKFNPRARSAKLRAALKIYE